MTVVCSRRRIPNTLPQALGLLLLHHMPDADIQFDEKPGDPESSFVTDLFILLRNLLAIPDPRVGDTGMWSG